MHNTFHFWLVTITSSQHSSFDVVLDQLVFTMHFSPTVNVVDSVTKLFAGFCTLQSAFRDAKFNSKETVIKSDQNKKPPYYEMWTQLSLTLAEQGSRFWF